MIVKTTSDASTRAMSPALVQTVQVAWPPATPNAVTIPSRRVARRVSRIVSAVSCPRVHAGIDLIASARGGDCPGNATALQHDQEAVHAGQRSRVRVQKIIDLAGAAVD